MYRTIQPIDINAAARVQAEAFERTVADYAVRYLQGGRFDWRHVRVWEEHGEFVAVLTVFERALSLCGVNIPTALIASVGVRPIHRRRGYASALMRGMLAEMHAKGTPLSLLAPFSQAFYRALGYELANRQLFLRFSPADIPHYPERDHVRAGTQDDLPALQACYATARRQKAAHGWLSRTPAEWERAYTPHEGDFLVLFQVDDAVEGYLIYTLEKPRRLIIQEWVWSSERAWRGLVGFLAAQRGAIFTIEYNAPLDCPLPHLWPEAGTMQNDHVEFIYRRMADLLSGFMVRLVHVPLALTHRPYRDHITAECILEVDDPILPENRGPWRLHIAEGRATVEKSNAAPTVRTDISTLAGWYSGALSARYARLLGRWHASAELCARLDEAARVPPMYMHKADWF